MPTCKEGLMKSWVTYFLNDRATFLRRYVVVVLPCDLLLQQVQAGADGGGGLVDSVVMMIRIMVVIVP